MTNVTNAVTGERATSSLMGHMNTLMGGMVMTARNTDSVTEDIAHSPAITLQSSVGPIIVFSARLQKQELCHILMRFSTAVLLFEERDVLIS